MPDRNHPTAANIASARRRAWLGFGLALGGLGAASTRIWAQALEEISRTAESIHQQASFKASRKRVYEALTDPKQFHQVTLLSAATQSGMAPATTPTQIDSTAGGAFSLFGGYIVGRQIELVPDERIVQAWRVVRWDPGVYSLVKFVLTEQGPGTLVVLDHTGFPKGQGEHLAAGWKANYWEPLERFLT